MKNVHIENCKAVELPPIDPPLTMMITHFVTHTMVLIKTLAEDLKKVVKASPSFPILLAARPITIDNRIKPSVMKLANT